MTRRTAPALWKAVKAEVTAGSKGGRRGQWSARKAQLAVKLYKARGGGYLDPKDPNNSLARWTRQEWRTKSGKPSLETGERYLPAAAIEALSDDEYAATTRAKRRGMRREEQFVKQPKKIARKTRSYRRNAPGKKRVHPPKYLYHATHLGKVPGIADDGLVAGSGGQFAGYGGHSKGRVFFSDFDGLSFWLNRMEALAEHGSDFNWPDDAAEWAPVALRLDLDELPEPVAFYEDALGARDSLALAVFAAQSIPPEALEVWDGTQWESVEDADLEGMIQDAENAAEREWDEDDPDTVWYNPDFTLFHPERE